MKRVTKLIGLLLIIPIVSSLFILPVSAETSYMDKATLKIDSFLMEKLERIGEVKTYSNCSWGKHNMGIIR